MKTVLLIITMLLLATTASAITKQDLLDSLTVKFDVVGTPILVQDVLPGFDVKWYQVPVFKLNSDSASNIKTEHFYVKDEGGAGEAAFHGKIVPQVPPAPDTFVPALKAYLVDESIILKSVVWVDLVAKAAECEVFEWASSDWLRKTILVRKPGASFTHADIQ